MKLAISQKQSNEEEDEGIQNHEKAYIYNLLKAHYYDVQEIIYNIQYYKIPLQVVKEELDKKASMGRCHLDNPENIKFLRVS